MYQVVIIWGSAVFNRVDCHIWCVVAANIFIMCPFKEGCASPILWALPNQLILAALEEKFDCIRLVTIDGVEEHIRTGDSFVDDTTCGVTDDDTTAEPVSSEELIEHMEEIMQYFLDVL
jgi:hypothetical protein